MLTMSMDTGFVPQLRLMMEKDGFDARENDIPSTYQASPTMARAGNSNK